MAPDRPASRFPSLLFPFAALGGAVGWAATGFLENPLVSLAMYASPAASALIGAIGAGLVGWAVTAWARRRPSRADAWIRPVRLRLRLVLGVIAAGVATGALVGGLTHLHNGASSGALLGGLTGVAALPLVAAVFAAGKRAERARLGSIVAAADRRAVWVICAGALLVPSLATTLDWPMFTAGRGGAPWVGSMMAGAAVALLFAMVGRDRAARRELEAVRRNTREATREPSVDAPKIDVGLGEGVAAQYEAAGSAYRGSEREAMVLVGDVGEAGAALGHAFRRSTLALVAAIGCAGLHLAASSRLAEGPVLVAVCEHDPSWCHTAGTAVEARGGDPEVHLGLLARACRGYDASACDALGKTIVERTKSEANEPCCVSALAATCAGGVSSSCRWLSEYAHNDAGRVPTPGADLACRGGQLASCGAPTPR
jgi:hypothetical protein